MELVAILERIIREQGAYFFDHTASGDYAKLVVDTEEGITLDSITELTRAIKDDEKINELFPEGIRLEVTSPGIDYPMTEMFQYRRNIDRPLSSALMEYSFRGLFIRDVAFCNPVMVGKSL